MDFKTKRITRWVLGGYFLAALMLAGAQIIALSSTVPGPDSIAYFEVADQIQRVGYAKALPGHWSPLYPLYISLTHKIWPTSLESEILVSTASSAALMILAFAIAFLFLQFLAKTLWPGEKNSISNAWVFYGLGLSLYFFFDIHRANLHLPDTLVFCFTTLALWAWCQGLRRGLPTGWVFMAGIFSGIGFLARSNIFHWSLVVGILACVFTPKITHAKRITAFLIFLCGLLIVFGPQIFLLSTQKGSLTLGEQGKIVFAETYGAVWKDGASTWPIKIAGGDVRIFSEDRLVNFPGFYAPEREYVGARIPFRFSAFLRGMARSVQSTLFGYWSSRFGLIWAILWAFLPFFLFGLFPRSNRKKDYGEVKASGWSWEKQQVGFFLVAAGLVGIGMHLVSFSVGYYLPPYLFPLLTGLSLLYLMKWENSALNHYVLRSLFLVGAGFALVAALSTIALFRDANIKNMIESKTQMENLAMALEKLPAPTDNFRRIAVGGYGWLGLYAVRLSKSQVYAEIPDLTVFSDRKRLERVIQALNEHRVMAILCPVARISNCIDLNWVWVGNTGWCLLPLGEMKQMDKAKGR